MTVFIEISKWLASSLFVIPSAKDCSSDLSRFVSENSGSACSSRTSTNGNTIFPSATDTEVLINSSTVCSLPQYPTYLETHLLIKSLISSFSQTSPSQPSPLPCLQGFTGREPQRQAQFSVALSVLPGAFFLSSILERKDFTPGTGYSGESPLFSGQGSLDHFSAPPKLNHN